MAEIIFWFAVLIIIYTYAGYSLLIIVLSIFIDKKINKKDIEPRVTFLITAYNEEKDIERKLNNTLNLDYPRNKLQIIVASDGSTDRTDEIVRKFEDRGVILNRVEGRVGKTETQNQTVRIATGEIIIFSDGTTEYDRQVIRKIVRNYNDPDVGAVSGMYEYKNPTGGQVGWSQILFWSYEKMNKLSQTKIKTITGCYGPIYSIRRELYVPLPRDVMSDIVEPLKILQKGYRIVFEPEALAYELTTQKTSEEFSMRIRVISRGMSGLLYVKELFNPFRYGFVSLQLFSHKVLRWLIPVFMIVLLISNYFLLEGRFYSLIFIFQIVFYLFALAGWIADSFNIKLKIFALPLYFCIVNIASLVSLVKTLSGNKAVTWQPIRN